MKFFYITILSLFLTFPLFAKTDFDDSLNELSKVLENDIVLHHLKDGGKILEIKRISLNEKTGFLIVTEKCKLEAYLVGYCNIQNPMPCDVYGGVLVSKNMCD